MCKDICINEDECIVFILCVVSIIIFLCNVFFKYVLFRFVKKIFNIEEINFVFIFFVGISGM